MRAGDLVEVRSKTEILATLDREGRFRGMPFMPEMLAFCGQRFRVLKRADKSCDTIFWTGGRRVEDAVHLVAEGDEHAEVRCDGSAHGGCQARCLVWWHEAWLKPAEATTASQEQAMQGDGSGCTEEELRRATTIPGLMSATLYSCQATRHAEFSGRLKWWDPKVLVREVRGGNVSVTEAVGVVARAAGNVVRRKLGRPVEPRVEGKCRGKTPADSIPGLQPGDWVEVKSKEEIEATLNQDQKNRGLFFDIEMLPYCGRRMRLLQRVERIIDERTGAMRALPNDCWIIEGAVCTGHQSRNRLFCTRRIYPYWREIWLRPVDGPGLDA